MRRESEPTDKEKWNQKPSKRQHLEGRTLSEDTCNINYLLILIPRGDLHRTFVFYCVDS